MTDPVRPLAYSIREAAKTLMISMTTLNRVISHDKIGYTRIGRLVRIPAGEVERVAREGLPTVPNNYVRRTKGPTYHGRPLGSKNKKKS